MALIVIGLLAVGFYMGELKSSPFKLQIYGLHKSFGMLVLALVILRVFWRFVSRPPISLPSHARWEKLLAHLVHILLYAGMVGMPLTGWLMSSAGDFPVHIFGLFEAPHIVGKNEAIFRATRELHETFGYMLLAAVGLHFAGALKHHFIDRDGTLRRMGGNALIAGVAIILLALPVYFASHELLEEFEEEYAAAEENASQQEDSGIPIQAGWVINHEQSSIKFQATQYGQTFNGAFGKFDGTIVFDPAALNQAQVDILVDIASIKTGSDDRDAQARGPEWFDTANFPVARFRASNFEAVGSNQYVAHGNLTIRGQARPLDMPFTLEVSDEGQGQKTAVMQAQITLNRLDFGVGQGEWQSAEAIGNPVILDIKVQAAQ